MEFAGSDWSPPCIAMANEVFNTVEFKSAVKDNYILLQVDYPDKKPQSEEIKAQNEGLEIQYSIVNYPTVVFADSEGRPYYSFVGERTLEEMLMEIKEAKTIWPSFKELVAGIEVLQGDEKYKLVGAILETLPEAMALTYYKPLVQETLSNDVNDVSGVKLKWRKAEQEKQISEYMESIVARIDEAPEVALKELEQYAQNEELFDESKQVLLAQAAYVLIYLGKPDEAIARLEEAINISPDSQSARELRETQIFFNENRDNIITNAEDVRRK